MDFYDAKENIQPLAQGRNASILHASLRLESPQELLVQRKELEKEIHNYNGDDPLSVWYNYIEWIEQSFPSGGKESGLQEVLSKCLAEFENNERYKQDRRMIKLYIKFIDGHKDPAESYQQLFSAGIGTMVADFYIAWAYCYDLIGNTRKADEIFLRGISCRAQPLEELQEARQHFGFSVAQRLMYKEDDPIREETNRQLNERRMTLTTLRGHSRKKIVGSIRTGSVIKSLSPGIVKSALPSTSAQHGNTQVQVFKDGIENRNVVTTPSIDSTVRNEIGKSVVRSIIDAARNQENQKEPGPWNKAHNTKKRKLFCKSSATNELGFEIHEDVSDDVFENIKTPCVPPIPVDNNEIKFDKPFVYPKNFCANSRPIKGWLIPVTTEEMPCKNSIPEYNKCKLYPRPNVEFQPEELRAYKILKEHGIQNEFTKERDVYWSSGPKYNIRLYPHFATQSKTQKADPMDQIYIPERIPGLKVAFDEIYNKEDNIERQFEEILALRIKRNETIIKTTDMDETLCVTSEKIQRRKSFFPMRKSLAPPNCRDLSKIVVITDQNENKENFTMHDLSPKASICSMSAKVVEDEIKETIVNRNTSQREIALTLRAETTHPKPIPVASEHIPNEKKYPKLLDQKQSEDKLQTNVVTENLVPDELSSSPFEIFIDDSVKETKTTSLAANLAVPKGNAFQFKTPALPFTNSTQAAVVSSKLPFGILEDENLVQKNLNSIPKPDFSCANGFFDPEETCSTQSFNIFLKAQSVSTPKAVPKLQPQRQFGNILKEATSPTIQEQINDHHLASTSDNSNHTDAVTAVAVFSPPRQQLSTILETSEHGSTQGTHTTGATTKSTLSSPEIDIEFQVQTTTNNGTNQPHVVLETVKELSCETSVIAVEMVNCMEIENVSNNNTKTTEKTFETPGATRLKYKCATDGSNFSIFEDSIKKDQKQVGNFSRLEENDDTATGSVFKALPPIRFQDDKTETIPKMVITFQENKFQDDKTETIPKMMFEPLAPTQFQENKTETISEFMLAPPESTKFEYEKKELDVSNEEKNLHQVRGNQDDSFEFFGQTPPKPAKPLVAKQMERGLLSRIRNVADSRTTLTFDHKRFCDKDIPEIQKSKSLSKCPALFEDELQGNKKNKNSTNLKNVLKNSFLPEFLLVEENQSALVKPKSKSVFRDSFIPDFSIIEDSQPQNKQVQSENQHKTINESFLPEFSLIKNTQITSSKPVQTSSDFIHVPETQPNKSTVESVQSKFSKIYVEKNKADDNIKWQQTSNFTTVSNTTKAAGTNLTNILMDTFMKDFSEINEPPPVPNDIKEIKRVPPSKNNSSLRFLNESLKQNSEYPWNINENNPKIANISSSKETKLNFLVTKAASDKLSSNDDKYFEFNCESEMFNTNISMIKNSTWLPNHGPSVFGNAKELSQFKEKSLHIKSEEVSSKQNLVEKSLSNNDFSIELSASELAVINAKISPNNTGKSIPNSPERNDDDDCEYSIYYKLTPKTPKIQVHIWDDAAEYKTSAKNFYIHADPDLNQTHQVIENMCIDPNVNPFNVDLINAFLEQHDVISFIGSLPTCELVGHTPRIRQNTSININGIFFNVIKLIGEGAYGAVFCGKIASTGKLVAMKQERPSNFWEYYICLEVQERIRTDEMLQAYMSVDYALIGNNSSILISNFSPHGSLITVCNKIKKHTMKNVDEYVVMFLASELLEIMDHLHAVNIIHADVKADNFLLMNKLTYPPTERHLQLIDFGVSIDMKLFKQGQTFSFVHNDNSFKCPEMRERRPWTYQLDLYGLAGVLHVLLFGKYMDIEKKARGFWMHKTHVPRYLNKTLWDEIFKTLLNVRDCNSMPNLQNLRALLKKEMEEKDKYVLKMLNEFNRALAN